MFKKSNEPPTILSQTAVFEGTLRTQGPTFIEGKLEGTIESTSTVSIGPAAHVRGEVRGDDVAIAGRLEGTVIARTHLHVLAGGSVDGDARYGSLQVDCGGFMRGTAERIGSGDSSSEETESSETWKLAPTGA